MSDLTDPTRYRVSLVCECNNDLAYGYGATVAEADAVAVAEFRKHHGRRARWNDRIVEHTVTTAGGSSHYEEVALSPPHLEPRERP